MGILGLSRRARPGLASVAAVALLAGCGSGEPAATDSHDASTPGQSAGQAEATSAPELAARGVLDIQSLPADAIPWDQVGLGWFLLSFDPDPYGYEIVPGTEYTARHAPTEEEIYLVAPDASVYFARDLTGSGNARVIMWLDSSLGLLDNTFEPESDGVGPGTLTGLDLESGAARVLAEDWGNESIEGVVASGGLVTEVSDEGGSVLLLRARDLSGGERLCGVGSNQTDATNISPDGSRSFCLVARSDGRSDVIIHDFGTGVSETIDVFKYADTDYAMEGWVDSSSVVISRWDEASGGQRYWMYNVDTQAIADYTFDGQSGTFTGFGANAHRVGITGDSVTVYSGDGSLSATVSSCGEFRWSRFTGVSALVTCGASGSSIDTVYHVNLATGTVTSLLTFDRGADSWIRVFPGLAP